MRAMMFIALFVSALLSAEPEPRARVIVMLREPLEAPGEAIVWKNIPGFAAELSADAIERLQRDPRVAAVIPDLPGGAGLLESSSLIGANIVRASGHTGAGVTVAVLDSGADLTHPDFLGRIVDQQCFCRNNDGSGCCPNGQTTQSGDGAGFDDNGHGTNVTGIIGSASPTRPGIAPSVNLVIVKVLDRLGRFAGLSQVLSGIDWVLTAHPEVRVINMSLLTDALFETRCDSFFPSLGQAAEMLRSRGGVMFACSGNNSSITGIGAPACIERVVSVGAVHDVSRASASFFGCVDAPAAADQVTCFTNRTPPLDLLGPGVQVTTTGRNGGTSTYTGTSQATPHAAAAAAILFAINPALPADGAVQILQRTGRPVFDSRTGTTVSRIDLLAAVQAATPQPPGPRRRAVRR